MMRLLGNAGLRRLFANHRGSESGALNADDDDEIEDGYGGLGPRRRRRPKGATKQFPPIPSEEGRQLMNSGTFGETEYYGDILRKCGSRMAQRLMIRELGTSIGSPVRSNGLISQVRSCFLSLALAYHSADPGLGPYTFRESGHNHPLCQSMLLWSILR